MDWEFAFLDSIRANFSNPVFDAISKFFGSAVIPIIIVAMILLIIFKKNQANRYCPTDFNCICFYHRKFDSKACNRKNQTL